MLPPIGDIISPSVSFPNAVPVDRRPSEYDLFINLQTVRHKEASLRGAVSVARDTFFESCAVVDAGKGQVKIGCHVYFDSGAFYRCSGPEQRSPSQHLTVGNFCYFGGGCVCEASSIGDYVVVGPGAVVGQNVVIPSVVLLDPNCVVPPGMRLASCCRYSGAPAIAEALEPWMAVKIAEFVLQKLRMVHQWPSLAAQ